MKCSKCGKEIMDLQDKSCWIWTDVCSGCCYVNNGMKGNKK